MGYLARLIGYLSRSQKIPTGRISSFDPQRNHRRNYAAAKTSRSTGGWHPVDSGVNDLIRLAGPSVRARVRQLVRDFPYFARAKRIITDFVVGEGIALQSRAQTPGGKYDPVLSQQIEDGYNRFMDEADIAGRLHGKEIERLAKDQDTECGEFIIVKTRSSNRFRFIPLALQMYEADWLTSSGARVTNKKHTIDQGIEYVVSSGEVIAYHFADPNGFGKPIRVKASDVIHGFETLRPGQLRGISPFTPGVIVTKDLADCMEGEIDGFKFASKWLAMVESDDGIPRQQGNASGNTTASGEPIEDLENGIIEYLRPGEKVTLASNPRPSGNLTPFVRLILGMLSVSTGVPIELLSGDYSGLNWAVIKVIRADLKHSLRPITKRHIRQCCQPIFHASMESMVMSGKLSIHDYFTNPYRTLRCTWQPPVAEPVDKLRDSKSDISEMEKLLRSPQEIVSARGRQLEDVLKEIDAAKKMAEKYGLTVEEVSTALANNPAALTGQKGSQEGGVGGVDVDLKNVADSYGVAVRAGTIAPQKEDEEHFREMGGWPSMSKDVVEAWKDDGGTRRPITLKSGDAFEAAGQAIVEQNDEDEET